MQRLSAQFQASRLTLSPVISRQTRQIPAFRARLASTNASSSSGNQKEASIPDQESIPDGLSQGDARGATGGGAPLDSSQNAPPKPKIHNASVPGGQQENMTEEQKREVEEHNREFEKRHDRGPGAAEDKVDSKFWSGQGGGAKG